MSRAYFDASNSNVFAEIRASLTVSNLISGHHIGQFVHPITCKFLKAKVRFMVRFSATGMIGFAFLFQTTFAGAQTTQVAVLQPTTRSETAAVSALPPLPSGNSTVMGGVIRDVDPVRDEFKLKVFGGGHAVKMLFDARTQVYRDGKRVSLESLRSGDHASVETMLDRNSVFAARIHMLSRMPEGQCQGQIVDYNPSNGQLTISAILSRQPIKLTVPASATIKRVGQSNFTSERSGVNDLVNGTLIAVSFRPGSDGRGVADRISILATPGSAFAFGGTVASLDASSGRVTILNSTDSNTYDVYVNPRELQDNNLHEGQRVRVTARFEGNRYVANNISAE